MRRAAVALLALALAACSADKDMHETPRAPCPVIPEPAHQSVVVGTIGRLHMVESRYGLAKLAEMVAVFKPDLVLVSVRVDPFREDRLEDASFEMTYVQWLAKARGIPVEPIDWFREAELALPPPPLNPSDVTEIERRETEVLRAPRLYTFEQANGAELGEKILLAETTTARYRGGDAVTTRRRAWLQHLAADAVARHGKPKKVLAFVDVLDRPAVDLVLRGVGYDGQTPADLVSKSKESAAATDLAPELITTWNAQLGRAKEHAARAASPDEKAFWDDRARVLDVVVTKKATCCVTQSMFGTTRGAL